MRILRCDIKHNTISVLPELLDDLWVLYNVIKKGDRVFAKTTREVRFGNRYDSPEKGKRILVSLGISVQRVIWDRHLNRLRVHGIICKAPADIGPGSHHTLNVSLNKPLTTVKDKWMKYEIDSLRKATRKGIPPIIVTAIDDEGYCVSVIRGFGLDIKADKQITLPGKADAEARTKILQETFKSVTEVLKTTQQKLRSPLVILGLGFTKNQFIRYLEKKAPSIKTKVIDVKSVNSAGKAGINEALRSGILGKALKHVRVAEETQAVEEVLRRLGKQQATVTYGFPEVEKADDIGAIEKLLITDVMLREASDEQRRTLEILMRKTESKRGSIIIVSTEHEAGTKLRSLGGVAALLRFPMIT